MNKRIILLLVLIGIFFIYHSKTDSLPSYTPERDYLDLEEEILEQFILSKDSSIIELPAGHFLFSQSLSLDNKTHMTIKGQGSAKNAGLSLNYHEKDTRKRGVFKPPIAAGKGSGDYRYDIVPGKPQESILIYRVGSNDPAIRMPELGRSIVHQEGLTLLTEYIQELVEK